MVAEKVRISRRRSGSSAFTMRLLSMCLAKKTSGVGPRRARFCSSNSSRLRGARLRCVASAARCCQSEIVACPAAVSSPSPLLRPCLSLYFPDLRALAAAPNLSAALSFALRDRGFRICSCSAASPASSSKLQKSPSRLGLAKRILHQPVFQRVEADQHQPSSRLQQRWRALQQRPDLSQLIIHSNSKRLKGPASRDESCRLSLEGPRPISLQQVLLSSISAGPCTMALAILRDLLSSPNS